VIARGFITRLVTAIGLWVILTGGCFLYMHLHPSEDYFGVWAYGGFVLLFFRWYVFIPMLLALVSVAWLMVQRIGHRLKKHHAPR